MVRSQGEIKKLLLRAGYAGIFVVMGIWASCGRSGGLPPAPPPGLSPNIEPPTAPPATVGVPYNLSFRWTINTAKPPFFWNLVGSMPPGLQFEPANGRIYGTPTTPGNYAFTMVVRDSNIPSAQESRNYNLVVNPPAGPVVITSPPPARGKVGIPYSHEIHASGGLFPYTCSVTGMLPPGITLNPTTCTLSGTPTMTGNFTFTLYIFDSQVPPNSVSIIYTIQIIDPLQILSDVLPTGKVTEPYEPNGPNNPFRLLAKGGMPCTVGPPYIWAFESGYFPPGLTLNADGTITGTPTASGFFDFLVRVTDCDDMDPGPGVVPETATKNVKITIVGPLTITTEGLPLCKKDTYYSAQVLVEGGVPPYAWSLDGMLPAGLTLDTATGHITGIPEVTATFTFSVRVTDSNTPPNEAVASYTLQCIDPIQITTDSPLPDGVVGNPYSFQLNAKGGIPQCGGPGPQAYDWSLVSGYFPPGLTLAPNGQISGVPAQTGTFDFFAGVTDCDATNGPETATKNLSISVYAPLVITSPLVLPPATAGVPYYFQLTASGGKPPYTWGAASGTLPPGLSLSSSGLISGTPTVSGIFKLNVTVTDSANPPQTATQDPTIEVTNFTFVTESLPAGEVGVAYTAGIDILGGTPFYCWSVLSGTLPPGITGQAPQFPGPDPATTGTLAGIPTTAGTYNFRIRVIDNGDGDGTSCETNGHDRTIEKDYRITIVPAPVITTMVLPDGYVTIPYNQSLSVSGGIGPYVWELVDAGLSGGACSASGPLPPELTLSTAGTISGTPIIANTTGYDLCVRVTDANGQTDYQQLLLRILQDVVLCVDGMNGDDATGDGTSARPFKTINRALAYASDNNTDPSGTLPRIGAIRVAGTSFGAPLVYHENIVLDAGNGTDVDLLGGWTGFPGNFCAYRGNVPNSRIKGLAGFAPTIRTLGLTRDTWIELFEIEGNNAPSQASLAIYNNRSSPTIARNTIRGGNASGANAISAGIYNDLSSPLIVENDIYGGTGASDSRGVWDDFFSSSEIRDNTIDGGDPSGGGTTTSAGVKSSAGSNPLIYDNIITGGTGTNSYGIWVDP
ncbi:MAG: putative Ig domain-containing protein, partial [bacterium JZ-2024 1]